MKEKKLFLDVHAIQTLPPSNVNRDDTGSPKTAQYGGVTRSRVSSQSWKKAIRDYFKGKPAYENCGVRTSDAANYIKNKIIDIDESIDDEDALKRATEILKYVGLSFKKNKTSALFFISKGQAKELAKICAKNTDFKKKYSKDDIVNILNLYSSIDLALFGRMVAGNKNLGVEASSQVAHAISTHEIDDEFDYFVAIDDLDEDVSSANMIGVTEFNSSTLYRYADVSLHSLKNQLNDDETFLNGIDLFVDAFIKSMPTGKSNSFANQTLPQAVILSLRDDRPLNLVSAFETPVRSKNGYVDKSIRKLFEEHEKYLNMLNQSVHTYYFTLNDYEDLPEIGDRRINLESLRKDIIDKIKEYFEI